MGEPDMELEGLIRTLRRRWRPIVVLGVLGGLLGVASYAVQQDSEPAAVPVIRFDACHTLLIDNTIPADVPVWNVTNLSQLAERVTQGQVPIDVAVSVGVDETTASTHVRVGVRNDIGSLVICSVGETPGEAEALADGFANGLILALEADAQQLFERELARVDERVLEADTCVAELVGSDFDVGDMEAIAELDSATQQAVNLCQLRRIDAQSDRLAIGADGVRVVPFVTLEAAEAIEISEANYLARVREGAVGSNVTNGTALAANLGAGSEAATVASGGSPLGDSVLVRALVGLVLGTAAGAGYVQFTERLDSRLRRKEDVEVTLDLPVLAEIPPLSRAERDRTDVTVVQNPRSRSAESFRTLRSALDYAESVEGGSGRDSEGGVVVLVTSSGPSEGKTTTLANLAAVLAEDDRSVLAVNCDFRRPRLHLYLGGPTVPRNVNSSDIDGVDMVTQVTEDDSSASPSDVATAQRRLIKRARLLYDVVLLDTAPILTTNDAAELLSVCDHVILVVNAGATRADAAGRAAELLERRGRPPLGVALVGTREVPNAAEYYYDGDDPYLVSSSRSRATDSKRRLRRRVAPERSVADRDDDAQTKSLPTARQSDSDASTSRRVRKARPKFLVSDEVSSEG